MQLFTFVCLLSFVCMCINAVKVGTAGVMEYNVLEKRADKATW